MKKLTSWICDILNQSKIRTEFKFTSGIFANVGFSAVGPYTISPRLRRFCGFTVNFDGTYVDYSEYRTEALKYLDRLYSAYYETLEGYVYPNMGTEVDSNTVTKASLITFDAMILSSTYSPDEMFSKMVDADKWPPKFLEMFDYLYSNSYVSKNKSGNSYAYD